MTSFDRTGSGLGAERLAASPGERRSGALAGRCGSLRQQARRGYPAIAPKRACRPVPPEDPTVDHADRLASGENEDPSCLRVWAPASVVSRYSRDMPRRGPRGRTASGRVVEFRRVLCVERCKTGLDGQHRRRSDRRADRDPASRPHGGRVSGFDLHRHVLVVLADLTNYCEAVRQVSAARGEVPSRRGYPGYLYSDLASVLERAGRIKGIDGSLTQLPVLTMPAGDITHPVPDVTGYITEGQLVLSQELYARGISPPFDPLASLSRLMHRGAGPGLTRDDHLEISAQLYGIAARARQAADLAEVVGEDALSPSDLDYLRARRAFETEFLSQPLEESRSLNDTLDRAWSVASILPRTELSMVSPDPLQAHFRPDRRDGAGSRPVEPAGRGCCGASTSPTAAPSCSTASARYCWPSSRAYVRRPSRRDATGTRRRLRSRSGPSVPASSTASFASSCSPATPRPGLRSSSPGGT